MVRIFHYPEALFLLLSPDHHSKELPSLRWLHFEYCYFTECDDYELVYAAAGIATRVSGFVNAPSLMQRAVARCLNEKTDIAAYDRNRETLYHGLRDCGFACIKPQGAFYLFVQAPTPDEREFVQCAKKYHILLVPGSSFACPGYVRIAYCVSYDTIVRALPHFKELAKEYGLC